MKSETKMTQGSFRIRYLLAAVALGVAAFGGTAQAELPEHGHVMLVGVEVIPGSFPPAPSSVRNCVDLAANQALPLHVQHAHMHFGTVNEVFEAHTNNVVIPVAPFPDPFGPGEVPWTDCASLLDFFGLSD
jgi:hypothetical protein